MKKTSDAIRFETRVPIGDLMKRNPTMIDMTATVAKAAKVMCQEGVGSVIILDHNKPIGIVTEEDINCKVVAKDLKPSKVHVNEIMSTPLITVSVDKTSGDAAHMMVKHKVIGIVTVRDLLTVSTELNDLLEDLIEINREEVIEQGVCDRCNQMSDDLKRVDGVMICPGCRDEDKIT
jgi:signal-transduction protein with cAMP-binding, CBS, and nucleotidyltransferase domain